MAREHGGSAFPGSRLTLRDYFAGQALAGWGEAHHRIALEDRSYPEAMARVAYQIADAMLAARATTDRENEG